METSAIDFLSKSDNANDYAEKLIDNLADPYRNRLLELYEDADERDFEFWESLGVRGELTLADYESEEADDRDLAWILGVAGIAALSNIQAFLEFRDETIIKPMAYRFQLLDNLDLRPESLALAAKRLVVVNQIQYAVLKAEYISQLAYLRDMEIAELYATLAETKALLPVEQMIARSMDYVERMTKHKPGSPIFIQNVEDLVSRDSKRGLLQQTRRATERLYLEQRTKGNGNVELIWIAESDHPCGNCAPRAGEIATLREWDSRGLPGAEVCKGGDYCKCHLHVV